MNWRELLAEPEGAIPPRNILNIHKTPFGGAEKEGIVDIANTIRASPPIRPAPRMSPNVQRQIAVDAETLFLHLWRRLANRFNRVMEPGYLLHAQTP
jgi:hypothetical protein